MHIMLSRPSRPSRLSRPPSTLCRCSGRPARPARPTRPAAAAAVPPGLLAGGTVRQQRRHGRSWRSRCLGQGPPGVPFSCPWYLKIILAAEEAGEEPEQPRLGSGSTRCALFLSMVFKRCVGGRGGVGGARAALAWGQDLPGGNLSSARDAGCCLSPCFGFEHVDCAIVPPRATNTVCEEALWAAPTAHMNPAAAWRAPARCTRLARPPQSARLALQQPACNMQTAQAVQAVFDIPHFPISSLLGKMDK